ncbi:hypothetical protein ACSSS7_001226 [Eimeria intestinalis]
MSCLSACGLRVSPRVAQAASKKATKRPLGGHVTCRAGTELSENGRFRVALLKGPPAACWAGPVVQHARCASTWAALGGGGGNTGSCSGSSSTLARSRWVGRLLGVPRRMSSRLHNLEKEDWILLLISLGWGGLFAGAAAFNGWRAATRETRHPYMAQAVSELKKDKRVEELLGGPLEVKAVEEHSEAFAPWKRLVLQLSGPKGTTKGFVSARRVGFSEEDLYEGASGEDEGGPLWSRPYLVKQWLLQGLSDLGDILRQLLASGDKETNGVSSGVGQWAIDTLFVLSPQASAASAVDPQDLSTVIRCKGRPADNPDFHRLLPSEPSAEKLYTHWLANSCLLLLCLYSVKRVRAEWKMAAERHHRHLQQLATRQLRDASRKTNSSAVVSRGSEEARPQAELRLTYFTGQLTRAAIDGVAHLEIRGEGQDEQNNPDCADMLQCELVSAIFETKRLYDLITKYHVKFDVRRSMLSLIQEPRSGEDPPFPVVRTYALDPRAVDKPAPF